MNKKWKQVLAGITIVAMLTGCGAGATSEGGSGDKSGDQIELTWFHHFTEPGIQEWITYCVDTYNEEHSNVKVTQEVVGSDSYSQILQTKIGSDDAPMIFDAYAGRADLIKYAEAGHLADLSDIKGLENLDPTILPDSQYNGKQYGVNVDMNAFGMFYNKDIFAAYDLKVPETLSEMDHVCEVLEANGIQPFAYGFGELWCMMMVYEPYIYNYCGTDWFKEKENLKSSFSDDKEFKNAMEAMMRYKKYWGADPFGTNNDAALDMVANGTAAMTVNGTWTIDSLLQKNPDLNLGFCPLPTSEDVSGDRAIFKAGNPFVVYNSDDAKKLAAAKDFISFVISKQSCKNYATMGNKLSCCPDVDFSFSAPLKETADIPEDHRLSTAGTEGFSDEYVSIFAETVQQYAMKDTFDFDKFAADLDNKFTTAK